MLGLKVLKHLFEYSSQPRLIPDDALAIMERQRIVAQAIIDAQVRAVAVKPVVERKQRSA